jgi:Reverse transcriptase (RNA-dependent DNA polymerase)
MPRATIERYKARLVAKGYQQVEGVDFDEVYAPVSKHATLRTLLAIAAKENLELHQLDIKTAFLNGELEETIYMAQPPGYEEGGAATVCRLKKAIYGLRQAPRAWHTRLKKELEEMGFQMAEADPGLWVLRQPDGTAVYILVYVDDMLIAAKDMEDVEHTKKLLCDAFDARDLGEAKLFLGMEIIRNREEKTIKLVQQKTAEDLVSKFGLADAKPTAVPMSTATKLSREGDEPLDTSVYPYSELVGALLYLATCTRPDIAQAVGALARYMSSPQKQHWEAAKKLLRYVHGTTDFGVHFGEAEGLQGYCDSDYAGELDTRRSTSGFVFTLHGGAVSWSSRLQPTVAVSTTEAEYMAAGYAVKEGLWLRTLLRDFGMDVGPVRIMCDNQGAIKLMKHAIASMRSKHIDVIHHFVRERVARGEVAFEYCRSEDMAADCLTKPLSESKLHRCCKGMAVGV